MKFTSVRSEGGLIPFDILEKIFTADIIGQTPKDFGIKGRTVLDEISVAWKDARAYWTSLDRKLNRLKDGESTVSDTRELWVIPLLSSLGYPKITYFAKAEEIHGKTYQISHRATESNDSFHIHIVSTNDSLEKKPASGRPRLSPHALMQEFLNRTEYVWGIVTNGYILRILRDSSKISRPVFIEFNLQDILEQEKFNEFALLYRLIHYSRMPRAEEEVKESLIEKYYNEAISTGGRVRDKLRDGVEQAIIILGNGFIDHPANAWLREGILNGEIKDIEYYRQLLRMIYRLLFLMVSEERNLVGPNDTEKEPIYNSFYSINRLRNLSHSYIAGISKPSDLWEGLLITFKLYSDEGFGNKLSIDPLNGDLFGEKAIPYLEKCRINNKELLKAIKRISLYEDYKVLRKINYLALDVEELGSVYESLLDFHPIFQIADATNINFELVFGSERKTTGSYYTNHDLVQELIKSALEPVIKRITDKKISAEEKIKELLLLKVCDPAAGSGHFLLAAARKIAAEVSILRTGEDFPGPTEFKIALRDVIQHCIYGVDLNPLSVDLCKLALWLDGHTKGKPLSFLDHRIRCGNSLIGAFSYENIKKGIPDEAFNPVTGDVKKTAQIFKKRNKSERSGQISLFSTITNDNIKSLSNSFSYFDDLNIETTEDYHLAEEKFEKMKNSPQWMQEWHLANLWTYSFFAPLLDENDRTVPTQEALAAYMQNPNDKNPQMIGKADEASLNNRFFHWFLEFPEVFLKSGFDCVLGNPPWERIKLQEKEFFSTRSLAIANASTASIRKNLIQNLRENNINLYKEFENSKKLSESESKFIRESNRFGLSARGDINTYAIFCELSKDLINQNGMMGIIIPTGIATDDTMKTLFNNLIANHRIISLYGFINTTKKLFPAIKDYIKFCLLTIGNSEEAKFSFLLTDASQIYDERRIFRLTEEELTLINPNTKNCPIFRTNYDFELTKKIYQSTPILINDSIKNNPWNVEYYTMFHMSNDSALFKVNKYDEYLPLYEAKMIWNYDHRFSTYENSTQQNINEGNLPQLTDDMHNNPNKFILPRYWVSNEDVSDGLSNWKFNWLLVFRGIVSHSSERSSIFSIIPKSAVGNSAPIIKAGRHTITQIVCLLSCLNSLVIDYIMRQKLGGPNLNLYILKQIPIIPPSSYSSNDILFIIPRVLELVYTSYDLKDFATDLMEDTKELMNWPVNLNPYKWSQTRRCILKAELDVFYFKKYGLDRDEIVYLLDPKDRFGEEYPSETFRVLKERETLGLGEYRTKNVIFDIYDEMIECEKTGRQYQTKLDPPPGDPRAAHKE